MDSDFLLIQKMKLGDESAIEAFVKKYYPKILGYCRLHISDRDYAADCTQETFERFFRSFSRYQHYGKAVNYLYAIAGNVCRDFYRKNIELPLEEAAKERATDGEEQENRMLLKMALDRLSPEYKEAAILYFVQERKQKEIARILGIGLPLVKYRIQKAREQLIRYLDGKEE